MTIERRSWTPETIQRAVEFVRSGYQNDLPECFSDISSTFLYALYAQIAPSLGQQNFSQGQDEERRRTMIALAYLRSYFSGEKGRSQRPVLPARQNSRDSTTSTVLNVRLLEASQSINASGVEVQRNSWDPAASTVADLRLLEANPTIHGLEIPQPRSSNAIPGLPSQQRAEDGKPKTLRRYRRQSLCCRVCNFFPAKGNDQRKKLEKHMHTDKHRRNTKQDSGEVERFQCEICGKSYNRRDNMRAHAKKHKDQRPTEGTRMKKLARRALGGVPQAQHITLAGGLVGGMI
ncbi:Zinc finger E-box-binding homeobox 1 [Madurella mycetomatis]|uniref:Zinc finger E-box-binding homeobox 1 n=1 Tax=Madurella mycetomatis TaxID=100816 RepID=A0A175VRK4_9PEZI|nr:Zinc finger E-box-binding homeobox 1 [Madurella mycetomatis]